MHPKLKLQTPDKAQPKLSREKQAFQPDLPGTPSDAAEPAQVGKNRKILVVDDNTVVLKAMELRLRANGFVVLTATDGGSVGGIVAGEQPDLIILDIGFPPGIGASGLQWDGMTIIQWLRRVMQERDIPIIILTGEDPKKHKEKFLAAGVAGFFEKPVNYQAMLEAILRIFG
jgi:CheY-like chemotaxis protein